MKRALFLMMAALAFGAACGDDTSFGADYFEGGNAQPAGDRPIQGDTDGDAFSEWVENDWISADTEATSTFSIDVDNASYTYGRRMLREGSLPEPSSVRVEEYVNFFDYVYEEPIGDEPFTIDMEVSPSKFGPEGSQLLRIGVKARDISIEEMKPSNIVLLIDTSGSMSSGDKLELVKRSLDELVENLRPTDTIGIVTYAGSSSIPLEPTPVSERDTILDAIDELTAGGSTNGADGIRDAYRLARDHKIEGGNNRVILMTDGDFNVGITGTELVDFIIAQREHQIALTAVGYGTGNYKDYRMEAFAHQGNGNYFYCDTLDEAARIFGTELPSTLQILASDVKLQVEFDPATVKEYRLIGYENRILDNEDFEDDTVDAGDIGPGRRVTAFYELVLQEGVDAGLVATGRTRYKQPFGAESTLYEEIIKLSNRTEFEEASPEFRFGAAVVEFAEILRDSKHSEDRRFEEVASIAHSAGYGGDAKMIEFVELVNIAKGL